MEVLDRAPPHSVEAEMGVLGSIILDPELCPRTYPLTGDDFYVDAHQVIWNHIAGLEVIDTTLLSESLKSTGDFDRVGGSAYIARLFRSVANADNIGYYANIVRQKALYRRLIDGSKDILRAASDEEMGPLKEAARCMFQELKEVHGGT